MHEFPPNVDDTSFGIGAAVLLVLLCVAVYRAIKVTGSAPACFAWSFIGTAFGLAALAARGTESDVTYSAPVWAVVLLGAISIVACVSTVRNVVKNKKSEFINAIVATLFGVGIVLFWLLSTTSLHGRGHAIASRRVQCKNNLKQIALAMHNYHDVYRTFPLAKAGPPASSWRVNLLPYLQQKELYERYNFDAEWDAESNAALAKERVQPWSCPQRKVDTDADGNFLTAYVVPYGGGAIFGDKRTTRIRDITDGTFNTMLVAEACGTDIVWSEPRDVSLGEYSASVNGPGPEKHQSGSILSSYHYGMAHVALADGSVRAVVADVAPEVLEAIITTSGGEKAAASW